MSNLIELKIIFFDGVCVLCNRSINIVLKYNLKRNLKVATLQGIKAQKYLSNEDLRLKNSVILFTESGKLYKSQAVLEISKDLCFPFNLIQYLRVFPSWFLDIFYDLIAYYRYRWYGKESRCRLPSNDEKDRFLD